MSLCLDIILRFVSIVFLLLEDFHGHIIDGSVVKHDYTSVGTRLDMYATVFTEFIISSTEIISDGLDSDIEFISNTIDVYKRQD